MGPFARKYPNAEVYAAPRQWSFPLNLPLAFLGLFPRKAIVIEEDTEAPWRQEFDLTILNLTVGIGPFVEIAFYHKPTRTLLVTDTVFKIPEEPPEICVEDPLPLLKRSRDDARDAVVNTEENRRKGWWKTTLFAIFFQPSSVTFDLREWPTTLVWRDQVRRRRPTKKRQPKVFTVAFTTARKPVGNGMDSGDGPVPLPFALEDD